MLDQMYKNETDLPLYGEVHKLYYTMEGGTLRGENAVSLQHNDCGRPVEALDYFRLSIVSHGERHTGRVRGVDAVALGDRCRRGRRVWGV